MLYVVPVVGMILCSFLAIRATRLLTSALWLAGASALLAVLLYLVGAREIAVIELSVGAGLVTVLFVFAISLSGEETINTRSLIPGPLVWGLVILALVLLGGLVIRPAPSASAAPEADFSTTLWQQRGLDVLVQSAVIFSGVLGVLGLLTEAKAPEVPSKTSAAVPELPQDLEPVPQDGEADLIPQ